MSVTLKERMRMALAEAGYPDARMGGPSDDPAVSMVGLPDRVVWKAFAVAGTPSQSCWSCWSSDYDHGCLTGPGVEDCGRDEASR